MVGGLAKIFQQLGKCRSLQGRGKSRRSIIERPVIFGQIRLAHLDGLRQRPRLPMHHVNKARHLARRDAIDMLHPHLVEAGQIEVASSNSPVNRQRKLVVLVSHIAPQQIIDCRLGWQIMRHDKIANLVEPRQRRRAGRRFRLRHKPAALHCHRRSPNCRSLRCWDDGTAGANKH